MSDICRITAPLTVENERVIFADASGEAVPITLPDPYLNNGKRVTVYAEDITEGVTVSTEGTGTVEGVASISFSSVGESRTWIAFDNEWKLIAKV